jgi:plastocyanin
MSGFATICQAITRCAKSPTFGVGVLTNALLKQKPCSVNLTVFTGREIAMRFMTTIGLLATVMLTMGGQGSAQVGSAVHVVHMTNVGGTNKFDPPAVDAAVGDQIKWVNDGGTHTATSDDIKTGDPKKTFNTGTVKKGQETTIVINAAGTYKYHCEYHAGMTGTITVK